MNSRIRFFQDRLLLSILSMLMGGVVILTTGHTMAQTQTEANEGQPQETVTAFLTSQPSKCISLKRGLVCYQSVKMKWQTVAVGDYCVVNTNTSLPLKCWLQQQIGDIQLEFAQIDSQEFALRHHGSTDNLATTRIEVKWVYKAKRNERSQWRLF